MSDPSFSGGVNIAMKIPKSQYEATLAFYRDTLGLALREEPPGAATISRSCSLRFGSTTLWLDCVDNYSRAEVWLELRADAFDEAVECLALAGVTPCDEVEPLHNPGFRSHWIRNPAGVIHLLTEDVGNS